MFWFFFQFLIFLKNIFAFRHCLVSHKTVSSIPLFNLRPLPPFFLPLFPPVSCMPSPTSSLSAYMITLQLPPFIFNLHLPSLSYPSHPSAPLPILQLSFWPFSSASHPSAQLPTLQLRFPSFSSASDPSAPLPKLQLSFRPFSSAFHPSAQLPTL